MEKITFVYPSRIMPGTAANSINQPESIFLVQGFPARITFYVYTGTILERDKAYSINVDVLKDGNSILVGDYATTTSTPFSTVATPMNDFVSTSAMVVGGAPFVSDGIFELQVTLFKGTVEESSGEVLDKHSAFVLVRKEWRKD